MTEAARATIRKLKKRIYNRRLYRRRAENAKLIRWWLWDTMGRVCARCGLRHSLEFDHPFGRNWQPRKLNCYARARAYLMDWAEGNLRLLCRSCNGSDGAKRLWEKRKDVESISRSMPVL